MSVFGKDAIGLSNANGAADRLRVSKFVAPSGVTPLITIAAYLDRTTLGSQSGFLVRGVVYSDSGGVPNTLLGEVELTGGAGVVLTTPQWYEATFSSPISVSAGSTYWLGIHQSKAIQSYYDAGSTGDGYQGTDEYDDGAPASWSSVTTPESQTRVYSVYTTYSGAARGQLSFAELEVPAEPSRGRISFVEMETPSNDRQARISQAEFEVPSPAGLAFKVRSSRLRNGDLLRESNTDPVTRAGVIGFVEFELNAGPSRGIFDAPSLEVPDLVLPEPIPGEAVGTVVKVMRARGRVDQA